MKEMGSAAAESASAAAALCAGAGGDFTTWRLGCALVGGNWEAPQLPPYTQDRAAVPSKNGAAVGGPFLFRSALFGSYFKACPKMGQLLEML
jgi:hypothetical protein